jgi:histidinol-phosphatase (PHP family)
MYDYHVHSNLSGDSNEELFAICASAEEKRMAEICITEHYDLDYPYSDINFVVDLDAYDKKLAKARKLFPGVILKQGLEIGLKAESIDKINSELFGRQYDFIIASQHLVKNRDPFYGEFFARQTKQEALTDYLTETLECLKLFDHFCVVGHIGYPCKYFPGKDKQLRYADYADLIDAILKNVVARGKGIEVNTVAYPIIGADMPGRDILQRYRELKGEIITFGSDTHTKERVGEGYARVTAYLKEMGFAYICTYEKMQPVFHKI